MQIFNLEVAQVRLVEIDRSESWC